MMGCQALGVLRVLEHSWMYQKGQVSNCGHRCCFCPKPLIAQGDMGQKGEAQLGRL